MCRNPSIMCTLKLHDCECLAVNYRVLTFLQRIGVGEICRFTFVKSIDHGRHVTVVT
jgi:hypothetical protein